MIARSEQFGVTQRHVKVKAVTEVCQANKINVSMLCCFMNRMVQLMNLAHTI